MPSSSGHPNNTGISADKFLPALHHAVSGSAGTLISTCVLYPLSLVITRLQVQRQLRREGKPSSSRKSNSQDDGTTTISPSGRGAAADPAPEPTSGGIIEAFSQIWSSDGGPRAFYTGLGHDATKSVLDSFLFFLFYEWFRSVRLAASRNRRRRGDKAPGLGVVEELAVGMAAGACSRFFTTPIANVVTRKQTASLVDGEGREASAREIVDAIRKEKGLAGFWSGYSASLVLTLNPSITFFLQEFLKTKVVAADRWDSPAPHVTFLLAAVSKAVASAITYPFQTAKTRLQTGIPAVAPEPEPEPESRPKQEETEARTPAAGVDASGEKRSAEDEEKTDKASVEVQASESPDAPKEETEAPGENAAPEETQAAPAPAPDPAPAAQPTPEEAAPVPTHNVAPPERNVEREVDAKLDALRAVRDLGRRSIFGTVAQIARAEGVASLYDGIAGELLKGFLGHGTAMLAKDVVHRLLFRLYVFVAGLLAEVRARRAARRGSERARGEFEAARERARAAVKGAGDGGRGVRVKSVSASVVQAPAPAPAPAAVPAAVPAQSRSVERSRVAAVGWPPRSPPETPQLNVSPPAAALSSPLPSLSAPSLRPPPPPPQRQLPPPPPPPAPRQELRALQYRIDRYGQPPIPQSASDKWDTGRRVLREDDRSALGDFGVNVVANMIDGTQRGFKN